MAGAGTKNMELIHQIFKKYILNRQNFQRVAAKCKPVDGGNGRCVCELTVEEEHVNPMGTLHGGLTCSLVDIITTVASLTKRQDHPGVSVDLNISFLRAVNLGETIVFDGNVIKMGKSLAFTQVDVRKKDDNSLVAIARHTKAFP